MSRKSERHKRLKRARELNRKKSLVENIQPPADAQGAPALAIPELRHGLERLIADGSDMQLTDLDRLSDREVEVLQLMAEGMNRREIAEEMELSVKTIESYRENMKKKLELRDTVQLAQYAVRALGNTSV